MRQALHIFWKDVSYLRFEVCLMMLFALILAWSNPDWVEMLFFPAAAYVISRLIHAEAIAGDRQFWITRPYRWRSLLGAKILFILAFVNLPILLAQWWIVGSRGFPFPSYLPGLLATQLFLILTGTLPLAALAVLTPGLVSFIFSILVLAAIWYASSLARMRSVAAMDPDAWPAGIVWIRATFVGLLLAGTVIWIVYDQYRCHRTLLNRAIGGAALASIAAVSFLLPWTAGWALQARFSKQKIDDSLFQISTDPAAIRFEPVLARTWANVDVHIPVTISALPEGLHFDNLTVAFEGEDGAIEKSEIGGARRGANKAGQPTVDITSKMSGSFFNRQREKTISIRGSLYMTLFGNPRRKTIPLSQDAVNAIEGLQCYRGMWDDQLFCRSAFRWPGELVYGSAGGAVTPLRGIVSYSPFPISPRLNPIETSWAPSTVHASQATIVVMEPRAHIRRDFEVRDVRLIASDGPPPWRR